MQPTINPAHIMGDILVILLYFQHGKNRCKKANTRNLGAVTKAGYPST